MERIRRLRAWMWSRASEGGFSLVELVVVVGILGVLSGIAAAAFGGFDSTATSAGCRTDLTRLQRAESTFYLQQRRFGTQAESGQHVRAKVDG